MLSNISLFCIWGLHKIVPWRLEIGAYAGTAPAAIPLLFDLKSLEFHLRPLCLLTLLTRLNLAGHVGRDDLGIKAVYHLLVQIETSLVPQMVFER